MFGSNHFEREESKVSNSVRRPESLGYNALTIHDLYQKPIPIWDPDYTTNFNNRFRPNTLVDDYIPTYIDPDYGRDPNGDSEIFKMDLTLLHFQHVLDDNGLYQRSAHKYPPTTHYKKTMHISKTSK